MASILDIALGHVNALIGRERELAEKRITICATSGPEGARCLYFDHVNCKCLRCGCAMKAKGTLQREKCPIGRW